MANGIVDEKIEEISKKTTKNLSGDSNLENEIKSKIRSIINEEEIKTSSEEINDLAETISKKLGIENNSETKIEAKKIRIEVENWKNENIKEVETFRKEEFSKKFLEETKKLNPELKAEELKKIENYGKLIAETYAGESFIDSQKDLALQANFKFSPGQLQNGWTDLRGITNFLQKTPNQIKEIKGNFNSLKEDLKNIKLPNNLREVRSFENVISSFNNKGQNDLFSRTQNFLGWADRIDKLTGGWLNKTVTEAGLKVVSKIGNQAIQEFATNALGTLAKEGFQKGFSAVLNGIMSGGVKAATTTAASGAASAAAGAAASGAAAGASTAAGVATGVAAGAASATGVGALVVVAMAAAKAIKKIVGKIADSLGINIKKGLQEAFGKVGGAVINGAIFIVGLPVLLIGAVSMAIMAPVLLLVFGGLFGYQMLMGNSVSSLVPPKDVGDAPTEVSSSSGSSTWDGTSCVNRDYPTTVNSKTENGITFYIFETENRNENGKIGQLYDLACTDNNNLVTVEKYSNYSDNKIDRRVLNAFYSLYEAGQAAGLGENQLKLTSGYRTNEEQAEIRQKWRDKIAAVFNKGGISGVNWDCHHLLESYYDQYTLEEKIEKCTDRYAAKPGVSNHLTGRALDLTVNTTTYNWLKNNGSKYGFVYNYGAEMWHWEYNPSP